jgi:hypothetical protein
MALLHLLAQATATTSDGAGLALPGGVHVLCPEGAAAGPAHKPWDGLASEGG